MKMPTLLMVWVLMVPGLSRAESANEDTLKWMYDQSRMEEQAGNPEGAFEWRQRAAFAGHHDALLEIAMAHCDGTGLANANPGLAIDQLHYLGSRGHPVAMFILANAYLEGRCVEADEEQAYFWLAMTRRFMGLTDRLPEFSPALLALETRLDEEHRLSIQWMAENTPVEGDLIWNPSKLRQ